MKKFFYLLSNRLVVLVVFCVIIIFTYYKSTGNLFPTSDINDLWFYGGILMVLITTLFIEPYFTSPKNVMMSAISIIFVFLSVKKDFENNLLWWFFITYLLIILIASITALSIENGKKSSDYLGNKVSNWIINQVSVIGKGKFLHSMLFMYFLLSYYMNQKFFIFTLLVIWFSFILLVDFNKIHADFILNEVKPNKKQIGEIFGVQSKRLFLVRLFDDKQISKFDIVKFSYSMKEESNETILGIVFDTYLLNQERWAKILQLKLDNLKKEKLENNIVYKICEPNEVESICKELGVEKFVGVVTDDSAIGKIRFEYSKKVDDLQEGELLELKIGENRVFYQVINGVTENEKLEARNEHGFIEGEAIQLGSWKEGYFEKFGWVPQINTPVFKADTSDIIIPEIKYPEYKLGVIPGTTLPSIINLNELISYHLALVGITGSGKTFISKMIIENILNDTQVICIDFTGEWKQRIAQEKQILINRNNVENFLNSTICKIGIFELESISNTTEVLQETNDALDKIFNFMKKKFVEGKQMRLAIVLEEAHTITPETTFLGDLGDFGKNKALVNKMTQVALQGRKYGVGLIVITQRTANVSKTVLTQCNTVICFQAFDETSFTFLGNYIGKEMISAIPNLKQFHAVVTGKGVKSNIPMIVDLTDKSETIK